MTTKDSVTESISTMQAPADPFVPFWSPTQKGYTRTWKKKQKRAAYVMKLIHRCVKGIYVQWTAT